jgi:DNA-binding PadR family transcriptional regulator
MKATTSRKAGDRELLLLGLLRQQEMHGYQLSEFLDTHFGLFFDLKKATAYNVLGKMEEKGWVESRKEQEGKRPPRRVFAITPEGEALFQELLRKSLADYRPAVFPGNVPVLFLNSLPEDEMESLLTEREGRISQRLGALEAHMNHINHPLLEHQRRIMNTEIDWVRGLRKDEEDQ